jgi:D-alanyl-D-alanine endopeptidase (penicillin-binding protein 7)
MTNTITAFLLIIVIAIVIAIFLTGPVHAGDLTLNNGEAQAAGSQPIIDASQLKSHLRTKDLFLRSASALVLDGRDDVVLYERHADKPVPIASITKLMSAMVLIDAALPMDEPITITRADRDTLRYSRSRLKYGTVLQRVDMLLLALAASENRAAFALARTYPGGKKAFVQDMNTKAKELGLLKTRFKDPTGLHAGNVSTPKELAALMQAAYRYPLIRQMTTLKRGTVTDLYSGKDIGFLNTNRLVRGDKWEIDLSKTGFISDSGFCLVMLAEVADRPLAIVLLNSWGKLSKYGDANRIKRWILNTQRKLLQNASNVATAPGPAL